jgi:hypothetical protein
MFLIASLTGLDVKALDLAMEQFTAGVHPPGVGRADELYHLGCSAHSGGQRADAAV